MGEKKRQAWTIFKKITFIFSQHSLACSSLLCAILEAQSISEKLRKLHREAEKNKEQV